MIQNSVQKDSYSETVNWMFQQLPMYQKIGGKAYKKNLANIEKLCNRLGNPQVKFKTIHVAGTNGKGSVSHMLASILQESGYRVGLYTSPHLKDFRERIKINGKEISEVAVIDFIQKNKNFLQEEQLSFFEMSVGLAFNYFAEENVDIAVMEVGLGGRLDSTNIIHPELSVITNIGYDHTEILGNTLAEIAAEKGGIIKRKIPVVIGEKNEETSDVFMEIAKKMEAPLIFAEENNFEKIPVSDLKGAYQKRNIRTVLSAAEILKKNFQQITSEAIERGFEKVISNTGLRGRWEIIGTKPKIICDTAHNADGLTYTMKQLADEKFNILHIVFGVVKDKDLSTVMPLLIKDARYYFCRPNIPRGFEAEKLKNSAEKSGLKGEAFSTVAKALAAAQKEAGKDDVIYVGGSTFTVAEII